MSEFLTNLKAGDEVAVTPYSPYVPPKLAIVAKRTPSGQIVLENGDRFGTHGRKLGDGVSFYKRDHLDEPTDSVRDKIRRHELLNSLGVKLRRLESLDTPTLERIAAAIGEGT